MTIGVYGHTLPQRAALKNSSAPSCVLEFSSSIDASIHPFVGIYIFEYRYMNTNTYICIITGYMQSIGLHTTSDLAAVHDDALIAIQP